MKSDPVVEVLQPHENIPLDVKEGLPDGREDLSALVWKNGSVPVVTYPDVPRLPLQDAAIALLKGEPGAGWGVARDVAECTAIIALGMSLTGVKDVWKPAFASAILMEAMVVAYTAAGIRSYQTLQRVSNNGQTR